MLNQPPSYKYAIVRLSATVDSAFTRHEEGELAISNFVSFSLNKRSPAEHKRAWIYVLPTSPTELHEMAVWLNSNSA